MTNGALGLAAIAREHDAVLDLVGTLFEGLEEPIDAHIDVALLQAMPEPPCQSRSRWAGVRL